MKGMRITGNINPWGSGTFLGRIPSGNKANSKNPAKVKPTEFDAIYNDKISLSDEAANLSKTSLKNRSTPSQRTSKGSEVFPAPPGKSTYPVEKFNPALNMPGAGNILKAFKL